MIHIIFFAFIASSNVPDFTRTQQLDRYQPTRYKRDHVDREILATGREILATGRQILLVQRNAPVRAEVEPAERVTCVVRVGSLACSHLQLVVAVDVGRWPIEEVAMRIRPKSTRQIVWDFWLWK